MPADLRPGTARELHRKCNRRRDRADGARLYAAPALFQALCELVANGYRLRVIQLAVINCIVGKTLLAEVLDLSIAERIQLVEDVWDSIATQAHPPITEAQRTELDRRLEAHSNNPNAGSPWEEVRRRLR